ncbi:reticulocalbin-3 precursor [Camelus ferus]|nr:reticulocalbin-3 precursor [Camelus ferus]
MRVPRSQPWGLALLLLLLPGTLRAAESHRSLLYHFTAVSNPASGTPAFWVSGWLGPQQYLSYNNLRAQAEPYGAWVWESQGLLGCELGPDNVSVPMAKYALNGEEFMEFDPKLGIWDGDWPEARTVGIKWMKHPEAVNKEKTFLLYSCPHRLLGHLERGRGNLEWKEPPSMRLKARPGNPGFSVLTCSAFSFYPPELQLRFLRNGLAAGSGEGDVVPNGDGSFYAWSSLTVKSGDEHQYRCWVQHVGLAQPLTVELGEVPLGEDTPYFWRIVDRMDRAGDGDGWVSLTELRAWIAHTQQRHIRDSVSAAWNTYDTDRDGRVGWEELRNATYGHYEPGEEFHDVEDAETYKKMLARDERRFRVADQDGDSVATREELTAFLHPEEFPHMRDIVIAETLEDLDKNKDGYVQVEEYIADLYSAEPGEEEPAWVQTEREQFRDFRDLNKDGRLDGSEVGHWVLPPAQDQPLVEANHLLHESDTDKDGRLSKAEILGNWNMFVGSQATNYGEDLTRHHDEL